MKAYAPTYVIVSPVRDEEAYVERTIQSVVNQTVRPTEWVVVDDGSRDRTPAILKQYAAQYPWITVCRRKDRGARLAGAGVMEAFYAGYDTLRYKDWEVIVKLDADLGFEANYFQRCFEQLAADDRLGICGGVIYCDVAGKLELDRHPISHVRGAVKLYRRSCWNDIGGLIKAPGWDTVDEVHANMLGWRTQSFEDIRIIQYRETGATAGPWKDNVKNGRADYVSGYHPLFIAAKCFQRLFQKPFGVKGLAHAYGYLSHMAKKAPRVENRELIRYIRSRQLRRLFLMRTNSK